MLFEAECDRTENQAMKSVITLTSQHKPYL